MRASTLAVGFASVALFLSSVSNVTAIVKNEVDGQQSEPRSAPAIHHHHVARSPQESDALASYDYEYSYPPPPPPTTYGEPSTVTSGVFSTEVGSAASVTGASSTITSALVTASGPMASDSDTVITYPPTSSAASPPVSVSLSGTSSSNAVGSSATPTPKSLSSSSEITLWPTSGSPLSVVSSSPSTALNITSGPQSITSALTRSLTGTLPANNSVSVSLTASVSDTPASTTSSVWTFTASSNGTISGVFSPTGSQIPETTNAATLSTNATATVSSSLTTDIESGTLASISEPPDSTTSSASGSLAPPFTLSNSSVQSVSGTGDVTASLPSLTQPVETSVSTSNSSVITSLISEATLPLPSGNLTSFSEMPVPPGWTSGASSATSPRSVSTAVTGSNVTSASQPATAVPSGSVSSAVNITDTSFSHASSTGTSSASSLRGLPPFPAPNSTATKPPTTAGVSGSLFPSSSTAPAITSSGYVNTTVSGAPSTLNYPPNSTLTSELASATVHNTSSPFSASTSPFSSVVSNRTTSASQVAGRPAPPPTNVQSSGVNSSAPTSQSTTLTASVATQTSLSQTLASFPLPNSTVTGTHDGTSFISTISGTAPMTPTSARSASPPWPTLNTTAETTAISGTQLTILPPSASSPLPSSSPATGNVTDPITATPMFSTRFSSSNSSTSINASRPGTSSRNTLQVTATGNGTSIISGAGPSSMSAPTAPPFPANSTIPPRGTLSSASEASSSVFVTQPGSLTSAANMSTGSVPYPTANATSLPLPTGASGSVGTLSSITLSGSGFPVPWNSSVTSTPRGFPTAPSSPGTFSIPLPTNGTLSLSPVPITFSTAPQLPNSTFIYPSVSETQTASGHSGDPATQTAESTQGPPWPASNSSSAWATGTGTAPWMTGSGAPGSSSGATILSPPWPTSNKTTAPITGTVSIPLITSSIVVGPGVSSASRPFTRANVTLSNVPTAGPTGTGVGTIFPPTGGGTVRPYPTVSLSNVTRSSHLSTSTPVNGTISQSLTFETSHTVPTSLPATILPPFPTENSTSVFQPTGADTTGQVLSTNVLTVPSVTRASSVNITTGPMVTGQPPFPNSNSSAPGATVNGTLLSSGNGASVSPTLPGGPVTIRPTALPPFSSPPFPAGNWTAGNATATPSGTSPTAVPILTGVSPAGTVTSFMSSAALPPFPTGNETWSTGTGSASRTSGHASGTVFFTPEPAETSSQAASTTPPPFPAGNVTVIPGSTGNLTVTRVTSVPSDAPVSTTTFTSANGSITDTLTVLPSRPPPFQTSNTTASPVGTGAATGPSRAVPWTGTAPASPFGPGQWSNSTSSAITGTPLPSSAVGPTANPANATAPNSTIPVSPTASTVTGLGTGSLLTATAPPTSSSPFGNSTTVSGSVFTAPTSVKVPGTISGSILSSVSILPTSSPRYNSSLTVQTSPGTAPPIVSSLMPALPPGSSSFVSTAANSTGLPSTSTPCYTVTVTNGTVTQVVTKSVLIPTVTASAETTTLYPPQTFNHTAYPPRPTCTSHWLNRTSLSTSVGYPKTWTSVKTNRTSSADLTTFLTSTASRSDFTDEGTSVVLRTVKDGLPAPTTTVSAVPLPSNRAYPWGGVGPLFRHHNMTDGGAVDRANAPHTQVRGAWWGRWEKHSDRLLSDKDEDDA